MTIETKPGFTVEEILTLFNAGNHVMAVKMLRAETGCSLKQAVDALRDGTLKEMPTFKDFRIRSAAQKRGPELLEALKALTGLVASSSGLNDPHLHACDNRLNDARALIVEIESA